MYRLKLFEDFEGDKTFIVVDKDDIINHFDSEKYILIDEHPQGERVINLLKNKLGNNFTVIRKDDTIFICSTIKPFLWKILFLQDDYFFVKRIFLLQNRDSTRLYFKCDGIKGILKMIGPTDDFHTLYRQSDMRIWYEDNTVTDSIKGSNWISISKFLSSTQYDDRDIEKINYNLDKESYPMNKIQDMLSTIKTEYNFKVSKSNVYEIPEDIRQNGIEESGYEIFKITSDSKNFTIFYYYIKAFNIFCVLTFHIDDLSLIKWQTTKTYICWDIKGLKSLLYILILNEKIKII
jgi:hypothetical protein